MLAQRSVDDAAVEEDLGGVCNPAKDGDGVLELVVIVVSQRLNPGLDLLLSASVYHGLFFLCASPSVSRAWREGLTCFNDMAIDGVLAAMDAN